MLDQYTVVLRGEVFALYRDQVEFDAPNYFSALFLGDFSELHTRTVQLSRNPHLFRIILEHMSGYAILPITADAVQVGMNGDTVLENLRRDLEFYGLQRLLDLLPSPFIVTTLSRAAESAYRVFGMATQTVQFDDVLARRLPSGITLDDNGVGVVSDGKWQPVLLRASGMLLHRDYKFSISTWRWDLTDPGSHEGLAALQPVQDDTLPGADMLRSTIDKQLLRCLPTAFSASTYLTVNGMEISADELAALCTDAAYGKSSPHPVYKTIEKLYHADGGHFVLCADEIVFSLQRVVRVLAAAEPMVLMQAHILSARLVPRVKVAQRLLS